MTAARAGADWRVWTVDVRLVVTDPAALTPARAIVDELTAAVDAAASRFRPDSEVRGLVGTAAPQRISPLLAELVGVALDAAERTAGDVDPTLGAALRAAGYDRAPGQRDPGAGVRRQTLSSWRDVHLAGELITLLPEVLLDLGATAKAWTVDTAATRIAAELGCGVLLGLGGDLAAAGPAPADGWRVRVDDGPGEPVSAVLLAAGHGLATSSTLHRRWRTDGRAAHHILDPRTCRPADDVLRTASVVATTCLAANVLATAAIVRGERAADLLDAADVAARLVDRAGRVRHLGGWPAPASAEPVASGRVAA